MKTNVKPIYTIRVLISADDWEKQVKLRQQHLIIAAIEDGKGDIENTKRNLMDLGITDFVVRPIKRCPGLKDL